MKTLVIRLGKRGGRHSFKKTARYYIRGASRHPTGAHLVGFSRASLKAMRSHLDTIHEFDHSHLLGFDTFLDRCRSLGLVRLSQRPIAYQRGHSLTKRR